MCPPYTVTAFEQATKPMMDTSTKKPLIRVLRLWTLHEPIYLLALVGTLEQDPQGSVKSKPPLPRPTSSLYQLPSEFDRSTQSGLEYIGGGGAGGIALLIVDDSLYPSIAFSTGPPVEFSSCSWPTLSMRASQCSSIYRW